MMNQPSARFDPHPSSALDEEELRDFDPAQEHEAADIAAATWLVRQERGLSLEEEQAFVQWLVDPSHVQAYAAMQGGLDTVRGLPSDVVASLKKDLPRASVPAIAPSSPASAVPPRARFGWLFGSMPRVAFAVLLCGIGGGWLGWQAWQNQPTFQQTYASARGQQVDVDLPDGSTLLLDTATTVEVTLRRNRREVVLQDGQALFAVAPDAGKPFDVLAGPVRVTVVGTRFAVRHASSGMDAGSTHVAVEQGRVRVAHADRASELVELGTGQSVRGDVAGRFDQVTSIPAQAVAAWRQHRISFDDTPLAQAVAEFERYGISGLIVHPSVAGLRIGGSFDLRQPARFAAVLPALLPVRLQTHGDTTEIIARP